MITKEECIDIFNAMIRGAPVSFENKLLPIVSEYLTEIKYENSDKLINLIAQNPQLIQQAFPKIIEYYCNKFTILSIQQQVNNLGYQTILYYG